MIVSRFPKGVESFASKVFLGSLELGWDVRVFCYKNNSKLNENKQKIEKRVFVQYPKKNKYAILLAMPVILSQCFLSNPKGLFRYLLLGFKYFGINILKRLYYDSKLIMSKPDIIHFESGVLAASKMYLKELLDSRVSVSFYANDLNCKQLENQDNYNLVWQHADQIYFFGRDLLSQAIDRGFDVEKPHYFMTPEINRHSDILKNNTQKDYSIANELHLLSIGSLEWKMGYEYILQAIQKLKQNHVLVKYRIVGEGPYLEAITYATYQLGIENEVELIRRQSPEQIKTNLDWADIFLYGPVLTDYYDVVVEAQNAGVPIICTDTDLVSEFVENEITGFIVPKRNIHAIFEKIMLLKDNLELRVKIGEQGRQSAHKKFQSQENVESISKLYSQLCCRPQT